jgi:hypothetical protein
MISTLLLHSCPIRKEREQGTKLLPPGHTLSSLSPPFGVPSGTIFGVYSRVSPTGSEPQLRDALQPPSQLLCAGYAMYAAGTRLILASPSGADCFVLDDDLGHFVLSIKGLQVTACLAALCPPWPYCPVSPTAACIIPQCPPPPPFPPPPSFSSFSSFSHAIIFPLSSYQSLFFPVGFDADVPSTL